MVQFSCSSQASLPSMGAYFLFVCRHLKSPGSGHTDFTCEPPNSHSRTPIDLVSKHTIRVFFAINNFIGTYWDQVLRGKDCNTPAGENSRSQQKQEQPRKQVRNNISPNYAGASYTIGFTSWLIPSCLYEVFCSYGHHHTLLWGNQLGMPFQGYKT